MGRKQIPKSVRFEVLKRDSFTCQYCGKSAPNVVLNVDHIKPVSKNGSNDIINLVTSCTDCNFGKGAKELSDTSAVAIQKKQLDELQARREQLEMMIQWKEGLSDIEVDAARAVLDKFTYETGYVLKGDSLTEVKRLVKKYGVLEVMESLEIAIMNYCKPGVESRYSASSVAIAYQRLPGILATRKITKERPWMEDVFFIVNIAKKNMTYAPDKHQMATYIEDLCMAGWSVSELKNLAGTCSSWSNFQRETGYGQQ